MFDFLQEAGFNLEKVTVTAASGITSGQSGEQVMLLSMKMNSARIADGEFDLALEALGAIAAEQSGRITVVGPDTLETAILRPVLGGAQDSNKGRL